MCSDSFGITTQSSRLMLWSVCICLITIFFRGCEDSGWTKGLLSPLALGARVLSSASHGSIKPGPSSEKYYNNTIHNPDQGYQGVQPSLDYHDRLHCSLE
jgi:hypothetical protein